MKQYDSNSMICRIWLDIQNWYFTPINQILFHQPINTFIAQKIKDYDGNCEIQ